MTTYDADTPPLPEPFAPPVIPKSVVALVASALSPAPTSRIDPSVLGFPPTLPIELALGDASAKEICTAYNVTRERFEELIALPAFRKAYTDALEALAKEGMSFKVKARLQAEGLLKTSWELIHNPGVASNVKADLIKATWRVAGFEPKANEQAPHAPLAIQINLSNT